MPRKLQKMKIKGELLKKARGEKQLTYRGMKNYIQLLRKPYKQEEWTEIFKGKEGKKPTNPKFCTLKLSFKSDR